MSGVDKTCETCQHRNEHGVCTNENSVFFGSRVNDGTCQVWENYDAGMWGSQIMRKFMKVW